MMSYVRSIHVLCPGGALYEKNKEYYKSSATRRNFPTNTHVYSTLERRGNDRFHVVSTWNPHGVFVGLQVTSSLILIFTLTIIFFAHLFAGIIAKCSNYLRHFFSTLKGELDW